MLACPPPLHCTAHVSTLSCSLYCPLFTLVYESLMSSFVARHLTSPLGLLVAVSFLLLVINILTRSQTTRPPSAIATTLSSMSATDTSPPPILALNLCLLPPPSTTIYQLAHLLNQRMHELDPQSFLYSDTRYAHVTVVQFYIDSTHYDAFLTDLRALLGPSSEVVSSFTPLHLTGIDIAPGPLQAGRYVPSLAITPAPQLTQLHTQLLALTNDYTITTPSLLSNTKLQSAFYTDSTAPLVDQPTTDWVSQFRTNAAFSHYFPHVTLGTCSVEGLEEVSALKDGGVGGENWIVDRLYVFQLGNTGTVRKQLAEVKFA